MSTAVLNNIVDLLDRPTEPIFTPKGDRRVVFNVPDDYLEERFRDVSVTDRFAIDAGDRVPIKKITLPDLGIPRQLGKDKQFSLFVEQHRKCAERLIEIFMGMRTLEDFLSCAAYCRANMNCQLFNYAMSVAILHRDDTRQIELPPLCSYFPDKFLEGRVLREARENSVIDNVVQPTNPTPIEIPLDFSATDMEIEHRVAYFREDLGINLHHWHWHLVYPFVGPRRVVAKDRRGELFYYMHHQMIARYNFERLCNRMERVIGFSKWKEPIQEGYFSKLDSLTSSRVWAPRPPNTIIQNINRPAEGLFVDIATMERWRDRLFEAIQLQRIIDPQGNSIPLDEETGIDVLGNLVEASNLSMNRNLYGDLHNAGHIVIGLVHDPDNRHLETFNIMGDTAVNMRDPIFYRWHGFIDEMFTQYKDLLNPYTTQLNYDGVQVTGFQVISRNNPPNELNTFWQQNEVNLARGLDFTPRGSVQARFTHLQYTPFQYRININNSGPARRGTVRIFIGPTEDERGLPFAFSELKNLMVELDRFVVNLKPNQDVIERSSTDSSLTIPYEQTFRNLNEAPASGTSLEDFNFCGCGWPDHMLLPRGTVSGYQAVLFVMISNYDGDRVENPGTPSGQCNDASSFCGVRNAKFPDRRAMGFPFDRRPRPGIDTIQQFLTPNMAVQNVTIKFTNRVIPPASALQN